MIAYRRWELKNILINFSVGVDIVRNIKIIGFILGGLVALVALLLIAVTISVNPNDY